MAERRGKKRTYISIPSSSSEDDVEEEDRSGEELELESESESASEEFDDEDEERSASTSCDDHVEYDDDDDDDDDESEKDWSDDKGDVSDDPDDEESNNLDNDESLCDRVIRHLREKGDLQELNLKECKSYLRKHGLRITGTKAECICRIMEHWRIKNGIAEALYPRSSFVINCTGDVCRGDVVLFTQRVYKKFDKMTRRGSFLGKRTVAGRVVKESYGAAKQQHTFTIEVLWSMGIKKLPPLFPLLVKGRNLYKLRTFRQCWKNEKERLRVLAEKHKRGAAARLARATRQTNKACSRNGGDKRPKHFDHVRLPQTGKKAEAQKAKHGDGCGKTSMGRVKSQNHREKAPPTGRATLKKKPESRAPRSFRKHQKLDHPHNFGDLMTWSDTRPPQNFYQSQVQFGHHHNRPLRFPYYETGSTSSTMRLPHFRPFLDSSAIPPWQQQDLSEGFYPHRPFSQPGHLMEPGNVNRSSGSMSSYGHSYPFPFGRETYMHRRKEF